MRVDAAANTESGARRPLPVKNPTVSRSRWQIRWVWHWTLARFASDIDTEVLEKARNGIYRLDELKTLSPQQLQRYFMRGTGPHEGLVRVRQELASHVEFSSVNLLDKNTTCRVRSTPYFVVTL